MRSARWRQYRGHLIVKTRGWLPGLKRFEVWDGGTRVGIFADVIRAELSIDRRLGEARGERGHPSTIAARWSPSPGKLGED